MKSRPSRNSTGVPSSCSIVASDLGHRLAAASAPAYRGHEATTSARVMVRGDDWSNAWMPPPRMGRWGRGRLPASTRSSINRVKVLKHCAGVQAGSRIPKMDRVGEQVQVEWKLPAR